MIVYHEPEPLLRIWLRNLLHARMLPDGEIRDEVDSRDTASRYHLYAGCGSWELALQWGGWPYGVPVVTATLPYASHGVNHAGSSAVDGARRATIDHILAALELVEGGAVFLSISEAAIFSGWVDVLCDRLANCNYSAWCASIAAAGAAAPHAGARAWIVALPETRGCLAFAAEPRDGSFVRSSPDVVSWSDVRWVQCRDLRPRPVSPGVRLLVDGDADDMVTACTVPGRYGGGRRYHRATAIRGLASGIVPVVGASVVLAARRMLHDNLDA